MPPVAAHILGAPSCSIIPSARPIAALFVSWSWRDSASTILPEPASAKTRGHDVQAPSSPTRPTLRGSKVLPGQQIRNRLGGRRADQKVGTDRSASDPFRERDRASQENEPRCRAFLRQSGSRRRRDGGAREPLSWAACARRRTARRPARRDDCNPPKNVCTHCSVGCSVIAKVREWRVDRPGADYDSPSIADRIAVQGRGGSDGC